jgi:hypothetical protein
MLLQPADLARINNKKKYKSQYQIPKNKRIQSKAIKKLFGFMDYLTRDMTAFNAVFFLFYDQHIKTKIKKM